MNKDVRRVAFGSAEDRDGDRLRLGARDALIEFQKQHELLLEERSEGFHLAVLSARKVGGCGIVVLANFPGSHNPS
jgi:hypothetical protein